MTTADERTRREVANAHRGEVVEGSGVAIEPRELPPFPPLRNGTDRAGNIYWADTPPGSPGGQVGYIRIDDLAVAMVEAFNGEAELRAEVERQRKALDRVREMRDDWKSAGTRVADRVRLDVIFDQLGRDRA